MEKTIDLTPNYKGIFEGMLREAQAQAVTCWNDRWALNVETLRRVQRWFAPLSIAAQAMTQISDAERLRDLMAEIVADLNKTATEIEAALGEKDEDDAVEA